MVKTEKKSEKEKLWIFFKFKVGKKKHEIELNNRLEILENMEDEDDIDSNINENWENIKK